MGEGRTKIRKNVVFAGLLLGMLVAAASQTIVSPAMPVIVADLGGIGIFQGLLFLGGGPALAGAFLVAREEAGAGAISPAYALDAAAFSDVFFALSLAPAVALIAVVGLRGGSGERGAERSGKA